MTALYHALFRFGEARAQLVRTLHRLPGAARRESGQAQATCKVERQGIRRLSSQGAHDHGCTERNKVSGDRTNCFQINESFGEVPPAVDVDRTERLTIGSAFLSGLI